MAELFDMKELEERVILVAVSTSDEDDTEASLDELEELADTAGATAIGRLVQNREKIHPGTYLGSGKIGELREMVWEMGATGVICDDELSPAQLRNLESALDPISECRKGRRRDSGISGGADGSVRSGRYAGD